MQFSGANAHGCTRGRRPRLLLPRPQVNSELRMPRPWSGFRHLPRALVLGKARRLRRYGGICLASGLIASRALLRSVAVVRFRLWLATAVALGAIVGSLLRAQVSDDEKSQRDESGKAQHETQAASSVASKKSLSTIAKAKAVADTSEKKRA